MLASSKWKEEDIHRKCDKMHKIEIESHFLFLLFLMFCLFYYPCYRSHKIALSVRREFLIKTVLSLCTRLSENVQTDRERVKIWSNHQWQKKKTWQQNEIRKYSMIFVPLLFLCRYFPFFFFLFPLTFDNNKPFLMFPFLFSFPTLFSFSNRFSRRHHAAADARRLCHPWRVSTKQQFDTRQR